MASSTGVSTKAYTIFSRIKGWKKVINMLSSLKRYSLSEVAQKKMEILSFYDEFGEEATIKAFGADRKVVNRWKKRLANSGGRLESLIPYSTRPKTFRRVSYNQKIVDFIKKYREDHPKTGKEKIKIELDEHCLKERLKTVSESTIGNIIKRHKFFFQKSGRIYHNPSSKWAQKQVQKKKRLRVKHSPKLTDFGHIQGDTVERITDGIKDYFYSAIDAKMKFTLTLNYKRLNSRNNKDFYQRFKSVYPVTIRDWQSDNGSENLGEFDQQLEEDQIPHFFSYPRCPKINAYIERYNRTIQEEFIDNNLDIIHDKILFNRKLADYLIWYNTKRPHKSLGLKSPLQYLLEKGVMSQKSLTYTGSC